MTLDQASKPWQAYAADELELHYNPRATNPDSERYGEARADINAAGLAYAGRTADIAYGDGPLRNLDIYRPATAPFRCTFSSTAATGVRAKKRTSGSSAERSRTTACSAS